MFGEWRKVKVNDCKENGKSKIDNFGNGDTVRNTFVRMANFLSWGEMGKISAVELRDVEKLYHLGDEAEITQKELADLGIIGKLRQRKGEEREKIAKIQELEEKEKKELNSRIKKLKRK